MRDRNQKGIRIIVSKDITFNEFEMPCTKISRDKVSEDKNPQEELKNSSTQPSITSREVESTPSISSEVKSQNQLEIDKERETIEEYQNDQPPVFYYQLARDREMRSHRLPQRLASDFELAYASYQELAENEPITHMRKP